MSRPAKRITPSLRSMSRTTRRAERRLAGAAFADNAEAVALAEAEIDVVHGMEEPPVADGEELLQPDRFEKRCHSGTQQAVA